MTLFRARMVLLVMAMTSVLLVVVVCNANEMQANELTNEFIHDDFDHKSVIPALSEVENHIIFELEHRCAVDAPFTPRGVVEIVDIPSSSLKPNISFVAMPILSSNDMEKLNRLLHNGHHYAIRAKSDPSDPYSPYIMTSVPMCMLAAMRLREDFAFHVSDSGKLMAIEYLTPYLDIVKCEEYQKSNLIDQPFGPFGTVLKSQTGPSPPKDIVVKRDRTPQGVEPVKSEDGNDDAEEENQSFLRKYWYIILPIVVMSLFGGGAAAPVSEANGASATSATGGIRR